MLNTIQLVDVRLSERTLEPDKVEVVYQQLSIWTSVGLHISPSFVDLVDWNRFAKLGLPYGPKFEIVVSFIFFAKPFKLSLGQMAWQK